MDCVTQTVCLPGDLLMLTAMGYAAFTAVKYWPAISV